MWNVENSRYFTDNSIISYVIYAYSHEMSNMKLQLECIETKIVRLILIPLNVETITELMKRIYFSCNAISMHNA